METAHSATLHMVLLLQYLLLMQTTFYLLIKHFPLQITCTIFKS